MALLVLWGVLLSSALAQVAQFVASHFDARDYAIANYIASQPAQSRASHHPSRATLPRTINAENRLALHTTANTTYQRV
ncbi:hypothetical protein OGZ01_32625 [Vibrio harveyi]|nr:hypothetical protein [Vibrio harveyi]